MYVYLYTYIKTHEFILPPAPIQRLRAPSSLALCMLMGSPTARSLNCIILDNALSLRYPVYVSICQYNQADWSPVLGLTLSPPCWGAKVSRELLKRARLKGYQSIKKML